MVGWHHRLNEPEFEQTLGDSEGQRSPMCCSPSGRKESDTTEQLNNNFKHTRHLRPWDFPGKSTGVGCHCLLLFWFGF